MKKVMVSGCFDMLHSGHIAFLQEAALDGQLYVALGSDNTVFDLKNRRPVCGERERQYMLQALSCVHEARISRGGGYLDFEPELLDIRPDIFIVNEDGHSEDKAALCHREGIQYKILQRIPYGQLTGRSTTALRQECQIPYRIDLAGGWLDQPFVSRLHPGAVLTISIEPTHEFNLRSGMSTSTRRCAKELWHNRLPDGNPEQIAKILFSYENPPGKTEIAGSQDALGIVMPGLNRLDYPCEQYWPAVSSHHNEATLAWLEQRLWLVPLSPREDGYNVLSDIRTTETRARNLAIAADDCWHAIIRRDTAATGDAIRRSFEAQISMFPLMCSPDVERLIEVYRSQALGWKLSGAGGGGYLILVSEAAIEGALQIKIRRRDAL